MDDKQKIDLAGMNLKPNSEKYKREHVEKKSKRVDPVVKRDKIVSTKKPLSKKFMETFVEEDIKDIKEHFIFDMLIPGLKNGCLDFMETMFFGSSSRGRSSYRGRDDRKSYSSYYYRDDRNTSRNHNTRSNRDEKKNNRYESKSDKIDYQNIILRNRADAERIVDEMCKRIDEFEACSVADFFDLLDLTSQYVDNNWGWTDENDIKIRRVSSGFLIDVPEAVYLD